MFGATDIVLMCMKIIIVLLNVIYIIMFFEILARNHTEVEYEDMVTSSIVTLIMLFGIFAVCIEHLGCIVMSIGWNIIYLIYIQLFNRPFEPDNVILLAVITIFLIISAFAVSYHNSKKDKRKAKISFRI